MQFIFGSFKKNKEGNLSREFHFITTFGLLQSELCSYFWKQTRDVKFKVQDYPKQQGGGRTVQPTTYQLFQGLIQMFLF